MGNVFIETFSRPFRAEHPNASCYLKLSGARLGCEAWRTDFGAVPYVQFDRPEHLVPDWPEDRGGAPAPYIGCGGD